MRRRRAGGGEGRAAGGGGRARHGRCGRGGALGEGAVGGQARWRVGEGGSGAGGGARCRGGGKSKKDLFNTIRVLFFSVSRSVCSARHRVGVDGFNSMSSSMRRASSHSRSSETRPNFIISCVHMQQKNKNKTQAHTGSYPYPFSNRAAEECRNCLKGQVIEACITTGLARARRAQNASFGRAR